MTPTHPHTHRPTHREGTLPAELSNCRLCPRQCGVDRTTSKRGFCGAGDRVEVFTSGPHNGEEPPISSTNGSGTVFFSRCTLQCLYCQNHHLSQAGDGSQYDSRGLADILRSLHSRGCHNWNLVSPTPWIPWITDAIDTLKRDGVSLPVVYNTSGFEDTSTLASIRQYVDVYLVDLRYASSLTATEASSASDYVSVARSAVKEMWDQVGELECDATGTATRGTICRLLILPGHADEAVENLCWLRDTIGTGIGLSVMAQYTPAYKAVGNGVWGRRISKHEYDTVCEAVRDMEFKHGWIQDYSSSACTELLGSNLQPVSDPSNVMAQPVSVARRKGL